MKALGVNDVRMLIPWGFIEPVPNGTPLSPCPCWGTTDYIIQQANLRGMGVLGVLNTTPLLYGQSPATPGGLPYSAAPDVTAYTAFVTEGAQRYAGQVSAYEVWNEPNSVFGWSPAPDAVAYTQLLKSAYTAIKATDPNAMVVGGVLVGGVFTFQGVTVNPVDYVQTMYANGAKGYFDALSIHPYQYTTMYSQGGYSPVSPISQVIDIRQLMIDNGDSALRIWATEYGLPTSGPNGVSEQTQANFIKDFLQTWAATNYAGPAFIYTTRDQPGAQTTENGSFGVHTADWQQKLAAKVILALTGGPTGPPPIDPGAAIGAALNAIFQQIAAAVAQAYTAAAQQIVQAAVTAYVNALAQAINNALGSLFTGLATPAAQQQSIAAGVNAAKMSASSLKTEPAASGVVSLAGVGGSAAGGVKAADGSPDTTVAPVTNNETITDKTGATDTVTDKTTGATDKTGVTDTSPVTGDPSATDTTPKSDPPVKKTDPPHPRKWKPGDDGTDGNGNGAPNATNPDPSGIRKHRGSDPGTVSATDTPAGGVSPALVPSFPGATA